MTTANVDLPAWVLDLAIDTYVYGTRPIRRILYLDLPSWAGCGVLWPRGATYMILVDPDRALREFRHEWPADLAPLFVICHELAHAITGRMYHRDQPDDAAGWLAQLESEAVCDELAYTLMDRHCHAPRMLPA